MTTILVIEDDSAIADLIQDTLTEEGYTVVWAWNGRLGLQSLASSQPALVLCDIMMPILGGVAVCQAIRADPQWTALPIIVMTATPVPPVIVPLVTTVLAKPFSILHLVDLVAQVVGPAAPPI